MRDGGIIAITVIGTIFILFLSFYTVERIKQKYKKESNKVDMDLGSRRSKIYFALAILFPSVNITLIFLFGPGITDSIRKGYRGVEVGVAIIFFFFLYFSGAYYWVRKIISIERWASESKLLFLATVFFTLSLWPLFLYCCI